MMTHRTRSGGTANVAAMAGNAMFIMESSDTSRAPAAASQWIIARMMARHAGPARMADPRRRRAGGLDRRRRRRFRRRDHHAAAHGVGGWRARRGAGTDGDDARGQSLAHLVPRRDRSRGGQ